MRWPASVGGNSSRAEPPWIHTTMYGGNRCGRRREVAGVVLRVAVQGPVNAFGSGSRDGGRGLVNEARVRVVDVARAMALVQISGQRDGCQQRDQPGRDPARALAHRRPRHGRMIACWSDGRAGVGGGVLKRVALKRARAQRLRRGSPARPKRRTGIEPASSPWKGEALPLSYRRACEPASQGGPPTMTVCTNHLAGVDLVEDRLPAAIAETGCNAEVLVPEVVELEDQRVGLAAVGAWALAKELD